MTTPAPIPLQEDLTLLAHPAAAAAPVGVPVWTYGIAALVLLALAAWGWSRRRSRQATRALRAAETPEAIALQQLARWHPFPAEAHPREAVAAVSGTMRRYAEARFGLPAPTLTTEEFWHEQETRRSMPAGCESFWTAFLRLCDAVKYAGQSASSEQFAGLLASAREFVLTSAPSSSRSPASRP